ncbi:hypothetical protein DdX_21648 [Ditylenchus destructor]|uniref:Uncharacterized protein n=1 Tax=Ditylenchus destructor TaxID=166010 RepID=A0AAD4QVI3_9BILA|nr:hypothetical protein DdX_21648 [Ditylenchus destructor]
MMTRSSTDYSTERMTYSYTTASRYFYCENDPAYIRQVPVNVIKKEFHADRPFLYAIVSQKQHVLFMGTVMDVDEKSESELRKRRWPSIQPGLINSPPAGLSNDTSFARIRVALGGLTTMPMTLRHTQTLSDGSVLTRRTEKKEITDL